MSQQRFCNVVSFVNVLSAEFVQLFFLFCAVGGITDSGGDALKTDS